MAFRRRRIVALAVISATTLVAGSAAAVAWEYDRSHANVILPGIAVGGVDVGGMERAQAVAAVHEAIDPSMDAPITVTAGGITETVTARQLGVTTDIARQVDDALGHRAGLGFPVRLYHRVTGNPLRANERVHRTVNRPTIDAFVAGIARKVNLDAVDAAINTSDGFVQVVPSRDGYKLDEGAAAKALDRALRDAALDASMRNVEMTGSTVTPATTADSLATVILVRVGENKLYLYRNGQVEKTYDVATGMARYATPLGTFKVTARLKNPTWINPAKFKGGWGYAMPAKIGPGRGNPLGTRALALSANGVLIHGTSNAASIGFNASHGCVRMRMSDVEDLFERVPVATQVVILRAGADRTPRDISTSINEPDVVAGPAAPQAAPGPATTTSTAPASTSTTAPALTPTTSGTKP